MVPTRILAVFSTLGVAAALLTVPTMVGAAVGDVPTRWTDPAVVASSATGLTVAAADTLGSLSVAVVVRDVGQGGGVGIAEPRAGDGTEFDVYTVSGDGSWVKRRTIDMDVVGSTAGTPDIATDGLGWAVTWQRALPTGRYEVVVATAASTNTVPTVTVLSGGYPTGYIGGPDPVIDGAVNASVVGGPRYLAGWIGKIGPAGAIAPVSTRIETREMFSGREWSPVTIVGTHAATSTIDQLKVAYGNTRSAAIGYVDRVAAARSLTLATRAQDGAWTSADPIVNESIAKTTGVWSLGDISPGQFNVWVGWAIPDPFGLRLVGVQLGSNAGFPQALTRATEGATSIASVAVAARGDDNAVLLWTEQDAVAPPTNREVRLESYVTARSEGFVGARSNLFIGGSSGSPRVQATMNQDGRTWAVLTTPDPRASATIRVFEAPLAASPVFWSGVTPTVISGQPAAGATTRGTGLLVSDDPDIYPRVLWAQGQGNAFSLQAVREVPAGGRAPGAPLNVVAIPGNGEVRVQWQPPADAGTTPISNYAVTATPGGQQCSSAATQCTVTGLTNGTPYTFVVVATNADGPGAASAPSAAVTPTADPAAGPLPPDRFTAKAKAAGRVVVKWSASASPTAVGYILGIKKNGGAWRDRNVGNVLKKRYVVKAGKTACYRVAAVDAAGTQGAWTAEACATARR